MTNFSTYLKLSNDRFHSICQTFVTQRPLVHCLTNEVVQEITANVLLASGASPAMVVAQEEVETFAAISSAVLINVGTPFPERLLAMKLAASTANAHGIPWVLDPVAAGVIPWRDEAIHQFVALKPTVIRGNGSEILALAGLGHGGQGVDSLDSSRSAIVAAQHLAQKTQTIVAVTGEEDFVTDGKQILMIPGGHPMATLVVGTGCSLSALVAGFCGVETNRLEATAAALTLAKRAQVMAYKTAQTPGSFHFAYIDALYNLSHGYCE